MFAFIDVETVYNKLRNPVSRQSTHVKLKSEVTSLSATTGKASKSKGTNAVHYEHLRGLRGATYHIIISVCLIYLISHGPLLVALLMKLKENPICRQIGVVQTHQ